MPEGTLLPPSFGRKILIFAERTVARALRLLLAGRSGRTIGAEGGFGEFGDYGQGWRCPRGICLRRRRRRTRRPGHRRSWHRSRGVRSSMGAAPGCSVSIRSTWRPAGRRRRSGCQSRLRERVRGGGAAEAATIDRPAEARVVIIEGWGNSRPGRSRCCSPIARDRRHCCPPAARSLAPGRCC